MGRRTDTVYVAGNVELGCLEIGGPTDQTKEWKDSRIKMPIVMKDMLLQIAETSPSIVNKVHILGYVINGKQKGSK